jgi:DNA oxidative demethylase
MLASSPKPEPPLTGNESIDLDGFSYWPDFISEQESNTLLQYFGTLTPVWEHRSIGHRAGQGTRRLTRPVYWLGAWQFACLGYYSHPLHLEQKCVRAEAFPSVMQTILDRLQSRLDAHLPLDWPSGQSPNTCLINFYGSEMIADVNGRLVARDYARLKMHRDGEPGPVVMFSFGQPAHFEFVHPERTTEAVLALRLRHRSVVVLSGTQYKDLLYHRITSVEHGRHPEMPTVLENFRLRRISVSFRFVPTEHILPFKDFGPTQRAMVRPYVQALANSSPFFQSELQASGRSELP